MCAFLFWFRCGFSNTKIDPFFIKIDTGANQAASGGNAEVAGSLRDNLSESTEHEQLSKCELKTAVDPSQNRIRVDHNSIFDSQCSEDLSANRQNENCTVKILSLYRSQHKRDRVRLNTENTRSEIDALSNNGVRYLVCKPLGGIGNFVAGLLSCLAIALITDRHLLLAPPPESRRDNISAYDQPISSLFDFPLDMSLEILGRGIRDVPFLFDPTTGAAVDTPVMQVIGSPPFKNRNQWPSLLVDSPLADCR